MAKAMMKVALLRCRHHALTRRLSCPSKGEESQLCRGCCVCMEFFESIQSIGQLGQV